MTLHLHSPALEAWLTTPPEYDDPLERVEFPRERKPWKRDREAIRWAMRLHDSKRAIWIVDDRGWEKNLHPSQRFLHLNVAASYLYRLRVWGKRHMAPVHYEHEKQSVRWHLTEAALRHKPRLPA